MMTQIYIYIYIYIYTEFQKLLSLASKNSLFVFDDVYYFQTDGVAMGSPLGPRLADVFNESLRTRFG